MLGFSSAWKGQRRNSSTDPGFGISSSRRINSKARCGWLRIALRTASAKVLNAHSPCCWGMRDLLRTENAKDPLRSPSPTQAACVPGGVDGCAVACADDDVMLSTKPTPIFDSPKSGARAVPQEFARAFDIYASLPVSGSASTTTPRALRNARTAASSKSKMRLWPNLIACGKPEAGSAASFRRVALHRGIPYRSRNWPSRRSCACRRISILCLPAITTFSEFVFRSAQPIQLGLECDSEQINSRTGKME